MDFMMNGFRHYGYDSGFISKLMTIIDTGAFTGDHFMGFKLGFMNVIKNTLVWSDPDQMITVFAVCVLGGNDVFQFNALEDRMFRSFDFSE